MKESQSIKVDKLMKQYEKFTTFLRTYGALLNLQSNQCLSNELNKVRARNSAKPGQSETEKQRQRRIQDAAFPYLSYSCWSQVLFQCVKLFILNKITLKSILSTMPLIKKNNLMD
eukprot:UN26023